MKYKLCILVTSSFLFGCSTFKIAELNKSQLVITPSSHNQLVKANTADEYVSLAKRYIEIKNYELAIVAYQKALQLERKNISLLTGLATTYAKQNLLSVSIPLLEKVARIEPSAKHFNNLGYAYYLNHQYAEANRVLAQAITLEPGYVQAQKNLALVVNNQPLTELTQNKTSAAIQASVEFDAIVIKKGIEPTKTVTPSIEPQAANIIVQETKPETTMIKTANGLYELNVKNPIVISENVNNTAKASTHKKFKEVFVAISGGITFKHVPAIIRLFGTTGRTLATFSVSDNNKLVEIINGNGIKGMARTVAGIFEVSNNVQTKVADAKRFNHMKTHIQYKTGYRDDAVNLLQHLVNKPYLLRNDNLPSNVSLRLVLGRDLFTET